MARRAIRAVPVPASAITRTSAAMPTVFITTNSYPWGPGCFDGAQIYAFFRKLSLPRVHRT
jgi:hypothetical protein